MRHPVRIALSAHRAGCARPTQSGSNTFTLAATAEAVTHLSFRHAGLKGVMDSFMKKGMDRGWKLMLDRALPVVIDALAAGRTPSREDPTYAVYGKKDPKTRDPATGGLVAGGIGAQAERCFANLFGVLAAAGLGPDA